MKVENATRDSQERQIEITVSAYDAVRVLVDGAVRPRPRDVGERRAWMRAVASTLLKHFGTREAVEDAGAASQAGDPPDLREEPIGITPTVYEHLEALAADLERSPGEVASVILSRYCTVEGYETAMEAVSGSR